jgi:pyruvate,orthophosphate dikinase
MLPLVGDVAEFRFLKNDVLEVARAVMKRRGIKVKFTVGTMIEVPRGALTADKIAEEAEFFSFGTNDLTQMTYGFSRDDSPFLQDYERKGIFDRDPFQMLDQAGVGALIEIAVAKGRKARSDLKLGICGEHGGEPSSVEFCHSAGLDYVSCSPYRVPIARLAAARAAVRDLLEEREKPARRRARSRSKSAAAKRTKPRQKSKRGRGKKAQTPKSRSKKK